MKITSGILVPVSGISATAFFHFDRNISGMVCVFVAFLFATIFIWLSIKDQNLKLYNKARPIKAVMTDEDTRLVIKAICDESHGFVTFNNIVRDTNLPLKTINKALDWLFINKFMTETKGRNGKVYMLTPEGKSVFLKLINEYLNTNKT